MGSNFMSSEEKTEQTGVDSIAKEATQASSVAVADAEFAVESTDAAQGTVSPKIETATGTTNVVDADPSLCTNCGHTMEGPFCGHCGQHEKSMIRFFGSVVMHFLDDIFGWDSRAGRTIVPLLFRPGFLSNEYFRGRRVHYVPPLRMYFIVSIIFFLALELFTDDSVSQLSQFQQNSGNQITVINEEINQLKGKMNSPGYVPDPQDQQKLDDLLIKRDSTQVKLRESINEMQKEIDAINGRRAKPDHIPKPEEDIQLAAFETSMALMKMNLKEQPVGSQIAQIEKQLAQLAQQQSAPEFKPNSNFEMMKIALLQQRSELKDALKEVQPPPQEKESDGKQVGLRFNDGVAKMVFDVNGGFDFLTQAQNKRLMEFGSQMEEKAKMAFSQDAGPLIHQILGVLPQAMFVLLPIFALLLKLLYLFSGRYYMEHLTVALHSHAFLFVNLLLLALLATLNDALSGEYQGAAEVVEYLLIGFALWSPIYLYLMQKRVYKQGFFMTTIKFGLVGILYILLLVSTIAAATFWGLYKL